MYGSSKIASDLRVFRILRVERNIKKATFPCFHLIHQTHRKPTNEVFSDDSFAFAGLGLFGSTGATATVEPCGSAASPPAPLSSDEKNLGLFDVDRE